MKPRRARRASRLRTNRDARPGRPRDAARLRHAALHRRGGIRCGTGGGRRCVGARAAAASEKPPPARAFASATTSTRAVAMRQAQSSSGSASWCLNPPGQIAFQTIGVRRPNCKGERLPALSCHGNVMAGSRNQPSPRRFFLRGGGEDGSMKAITAIAALVVVAVPLAFGATAQGKVSPLQSQASVMGFDDAYSRSAAQREADYFRAPQPAESTRLGEQLPPPAACSTLFSRRRVSLNRAAESGGTARQ